MKWRDVDFLLGYDFLEQIDVEFDLANSAVRLFQPQDCGDLPLAYWARGTLDVVKLEVDNVKPAIRVPVKLNGKSLIAELDSGTSRSVLSRLAAAQLGVTADTPGTQAAAGKLNGLGAGEPDNLVGAFESFIIGGEIIRNADIAFADLPGGFGRRNRFAPRHASRARGYAARRRFPPRASCVRRPQPRQALLHL